MPSIELGEIYDLLDNDRQRDNNEVFKTALHNIELIVTALESRIIVLENKVTELEG